MEQSTNETPEGMVDVTAVPEGSLEHTAPPQGRPLGAPGPGEPASEDSVVNYGGRTDQPNMFLITGSDDPKAYLLRGRLNAQQIADVKQMLADENLVDFGDPDLMGLVAYEFNASAGVDGQARDDFMRTQGSMAKAVAGMRGFFGRGAAGMDPNANRGP